MLLIQFNSIQLVTWGVTNRDVLLLATMQYILNYESAQIKLSSRLLAKNNPMNLPMNMNTQLCNHKSSKFQNTKSQKEQNKICI